MLKDNIYLIILSIYLLVLAPDVIRLIGLIRKPPLNFDVNKYFYRINGIVLICGISLTGILIAFEINFFNYSKPIDYAQKDLIGLDDFNGFKLPGQTLQGESEFAFITTNIEYTKGEDFVDIAAYFHPARSFVYIDDLQDDDLLRHEMYHFYITEIGARNFRKEVSELDDLPTLKLLESIFENVTDQSNTMQRQYDFDTDHSYLLGQQIEWQSKIDSLLKSLNDYSDRIIHF